MNWIKVALMKVARSAVEDLVREALDKAVEEIGEEIDEMGFETEEQRDGLKAGVVLLRGKVSEAIKKLF